MELSEILKIAEENNNKEKRAFLFPGQGAQYVGMGKEIYNKYEEAKKIYDKAEKISEMPIRKICFEGPEEDLNKTENTQMAIFITSLAMLEILKNKNIEAKIAAGLSLGEYTALVYAGILDIENGIKLIKKRGYYMANLLPKEQYSMAAIIGIESKKIEEKCKEIAEKTGLFIVPANYNYANQTVISGNDQAIDQAMTELKEIGAKRTIKLKTSGPFHTKKLEKAKSLYDELSEDCKKQVTNIALLNDSKEKYRDLEGKKDELLSAKDDIKNGNLNEAQKKLKKLPSKFSYKGTTVADLNKKLNKNQKWV